MKKLLIALAAVALFAAPASAVNLRQNNDSTACWENAAKGTCSPTGEHMFQIAIPDLAVASTQYISVPYAGRLRYARLVVPSTVITATGVIEFFISRPASLGDSVVTDGAGFNAFQPVTPNVTEAATGLYELHVPISYAATGQVADLDFISLGSTTASFNRFSVIAIRNNAMTLQNGTDDDGYLTIIVH